MAYDNTSPAQAHQALSDIDIIRNNTNELRKFEASLTTEPPSNPVGGQFWWTTDTTSLYQRNQANNAWIYLWSEADLPANESGVNNHINTNITNSVAVHGIKQGSGNGFDADKLDGYEASAFLGAAHGTASSGVHGSGSSILLHLPTTVPILIIAASAPTGWTQNTSYNDRVIRIVSGAGGGQGGSWTISGLSGGGAHTHGITNDGAHYHDQNYETIGGQNNSFGGDEIIAQAPNYTSKMRLKTGSAFTVPGDLYLLRAGTQNSSSHSHGGATTSGGSAVSQDGSWRPLYLDMIAITKNP